MTKVTKLSKNHLLKHTPTREEVEQGGKKNRKSKLTNQEKYSSHNTKGHFSKNHLWPFRNENKKGHKV